MRKGRQHMKLGGFRVTVSPSAGKWQVRIWQAEHLVGFAERNTKSEALDAYGIGAAIVRESIPKAMAAAGGGR